MIPQNDPGPYSALFDYEKETEWEKQRAEQQLESQKRIMRTNALGDALGLLVDAVGGSQGATVNKRPPNPYLMRASDRYNMIGDRLDTKVDRIRLMDLSQRNKDLEYQIENKRIGEKNIREDQKTAEQRTWQEGQAKAHEEWSDRNREDTQVFQSEKDLKDFAQQKELAKTQNINQRGLETFRTDEDIRQAKTIQDYQLKGVDRSDRSKKMLKDDIPFQVPGTTQIIYLRTEEVAEMVHTLIQDIKVNGGIIMDPVLRALERNEQVKPTSLIEVIKQNWNKVKYVMPEYAPDKPAEITPQQRSYQEYQGKKDEIDSDPELSPRQKVKKRNKLYDQYDNVIKAQKGQGIQLKDNEKSEINNLINANISKEQKRSAIYNYMIRAGYDKEKAKQFAQLAYDNL